MKEKIGVSRKGGTWRWDFSSYVYHDVDDHDSWVETSYFFSTG